MSFTTVPMRFADTPLLWRVQNVYSPTECREMVARIESWSPTIATNNPIYRNQDRVMRDDPEFTADLFARLRAHLPERIGELSLVGLNDRLRFYRYQPGQRFEAHTDHWYQPDETHITLLTVLVYFNDDFTGGETRFIEHVEDVVVPQPGLAAVFQHKIRHEGCEVTAGQKYALRTDVIYEAPRRIRRVLRSDRRAIARPRGPRSRGYLDFRFHPGTLLGMPKITPASPILTSALLKGRAPLVLNPRPAPPAVDRVVVTPPPGPAQNGPIQNPRTPPPGTTGPALARWVAGELAAQESLRSASFWDSGYLLGLLMPSKELLGFNDLKTLIEASKLPISHFTAQKYLMVARSFERETAKNTGIEKCYALTLYAKAIGRAGQAAQILANDEPIQGTELPQRPRAKTISASQLMAAARRLKSASKEEKVPTAVQQQREKMSQDTRKAVRSMGLRKASTKVVRHDGEQKIAIYVSFAEAEAWQSNKIPAITAMLAKEAKKQPEVLKLLRAQLPGLVLKRAAA